MKNVIRCILSTIFVISFSCVCFAGIEKSGDYYRYKENGEYVYSGFVEDEHQRYYVNDNGYVAVNTWVVVSDDEKYYASKTGELCQNTIETIDGKGYYFDADCKIRYGWIDGVYYSNDEGYLVTGFQRLPVFSDDWLKKDKKKDIDNTGELRWFYFMTSGNDKYKKYCSEDDDYSTKNIDNKKYCFDIDGVMCTGWIKIKDKEPPMLGYMYFSEDETEEFSYGQAVTGSWFTAEGPIDDIVTGDADVRYYYFKHTGEPVCAKEGEYLKYRIGEKTYCFNDKGVAVYGVKKIGSDYYYFGDSMTNCSMKTGKLAVDTGSGHKLEYYFDDDGKGYTGVYKDKLYYKGLLQKAESGCVAIKIEGVTRLVNSNGQILKNKKKYKDPDGVIWSTNASGVVTYTDEGGANDPEEPEITGDD